MLIASLPAGPIPGTLRRLAAGPSPSQSRWPRGWGRGRPREETLEEVTQRVRRPLRRAGIEVDETGEFYLVKAELPGITRDNVELQVDEHSLSITGSVREEQGEHLMHRRAGRFFYRTVLPRDIDTDKVQANMKEGIPTIGLPKTKQATRRVQIRA